MNIAIIGAGNVGQALADGWAAKGHGVSFGVRNPESAKAGAVDRTKFKVLANAQAVAGAEVVVLATPWPATRDAIAACGSLAGKIVLDATNPLLPNLGGLEIGHSTSGGEMVAQWAAGSKVVKIFNTTGFNNMSNPAYGSERASMLYCGDDAPAKTTAASLAADLGFDPVDCGPLVHSRYLENIAMMWIWLAVKGGLGRDVAWKLLRR